MKKYEIPACKKDCVEHKYHCAKCDAPITYSPQNFASRPNDIPNRCENCFPFPAPTITYL